MPPRWHQAYMDARSAAKLPSLVQAMRLYESVLDVFTERDFPADWAMTQNNLGLAYTALPPKVQHYRLSHICAKAHCFKQHPCGCQGERST